ncbi:MULTISPECIES: SDR family oxidoreductase [Sorangium]|uniref:Ketoacyl reductase n=1 Tax=Sorangium cellulosum TaxID=56 RepID=A0A4P2QX88_SORCE|nr:MULTISPECIES: SDR family oxidoreductase [Sorangium]AUX35129.1 ketoacyl reductase [Sorangium cellulosum]WCQ94434.1 FabG-like 3-oxoacyl-(acyl-carrier-protein) reductase [Sorangium sp. Soce836]
MAFRKRRSPVLFPAAALGAAALARTAFRALRRLDLRGRVVVVTGGSRGLGLLLAEEFGRHGARVAIAGRDPGALDRAEQRLRALGVEVHAVACDLGDRAAAEAFIDGVARAFGRIDVLVNNAGVIQVAPMQDLRVEELEEAMRSNYWSAVYTTRRALPHLEKQGRAARIVNVASIGGRVAVPHLLGYNASKFAMVGLSESLQAELSYGGARGPRVTTVIPGPMRTGSIYNAEFGGDPRREFGWFGLASSIPLATIDARRAARRVVAAAREGRAEVKLGLSSHLLSWVHGIAPQMTVRLMGLVNALLPAPRGAAGTTRGRDLRAPAQGSALLRLSNEAARRNNEAPPEAAR